MGKYKIEIKNAISGAGMPTVEFEEKIEEEAKAKSYRLFLNSAKSYPDGEYVAGLYRKNKLRSNYEKVSAPMISCIVNDGESSLTVERVVYGRESDLLNQLIELHRSLNVIRIDYASCNKRPDPIQPKDIKVLSKKIKEIFHTLYSDYQPEYLGIDELDSIKKKIEDCNSLLENAYKAYGNLSDNSSYTSIIAVMAGDLQLIIQSILGKINLIKE